MDKGKVSIIVPVYNVELYIDKCIGSIIDQSYKNLEIILVDDGSKDSSGKICDKYQNKDERIRVFHKANGGLSSARNYGIKKATGDWYVFVDSDDWIDKYMIQRLIMFAEETSMEIVCCGKVLVDLNGTEQKIHTLENFCLSPEKTIPLAVFDKEVGISAWGKIYKKQLFEGIRFPEGEIHEDVAIMYRLFMKCKKIGVINKALYFYRNNPEGISKQDYNEKYDVVLKHDLENEKIIGSLSRELKEIMSVAVANSCVDMLIKIIKTPNGIKIYNKQYKQYKKNLKERIILYCFNREIAAKKKIWAILLVSNIGKIIGMVKQKGKI